MPLVTPESKKTVDTTVFIPTFNGEKYLDRLLHAVESQDFAGNFEILIIDSGSSDATLDIIGTHSAVRLVEIPGSEFGHGKTRNLAAKLARGTNIAYLSHDAIPTDVNWLTNITAPLDPQGLNCVGVVGKHIARAHCSPLLKYEIEGVFRACGPDGEITVIDGALSKTHELTSGELFYSDVNSATRREFLLTTIPYRDVNFSEDMAFARDLLEAEYRKAYSATAVVEHSNDVTFAEYGKRIFDETLGMRKVGEGRQSLSWFQAKVRTVRDVLVSSGRIIRDEDYSVWAKAHWLFVNPAYAWTKWVNIRRALNVSLDDYSRIAKYSLEAARA
ncbi:rhamnosyltransferase [Aurantimicrobium minutum]|uniref:glycosyltransferase family 2 protein n=1 Tax=Aurantimicrobium minutum TaxID=708131 RepID=UPI002476D013|nr:glycosyltransferase family 2 protein [Aurantimicrobium minutum]MDH6533340.1 rhamnosyltransferase [Aurantimicrobium minutum]